MATVKTKYSMNSRSLQAIGVASSKVSKTNDFRFKSVKYNRAGDYFTVKYYGYTNGKLKNSAIKVRITEYGKASFPK
jgi:hypothetical protein